MDDPLDSVFWRDEILEIMYWLRGEGLDDTVQPADIAKFLSAGADIIAEHLERLVSEGYVARLTDGYQLTALGIKEGGRRFADAFAGMTGQAHGECNNPNCACQTLGPEACESKSAHVH